MAALSILFGLKPHGARSELELRAEQLVAALELAWPDGVIADLREGRLTWTEDWLHEIAATVTSTIDHEEAEDS